MANKPVRFVVPAHKARNPLVAAAHFRRAGAHGKTTKAERQRQRQDLERKLTTLVAGDETEPGND